jgi:putative tricarboxylic transport membrane protein
MFEGVFAGLLAGAPLAIQPYNILMCFVGAAFGMLVGVLPGLSATMGIALLIPLTFGMHPVAALMMLTAIHAGANTGCSISAILVSTPGTPAAAATTLDGYKMALKGLAGKAISIAVIGGFIGGIFSVLVLLFMAPPLSHFSVRFGPVEYFWLAVFGLTAVGSLSGKSPLKGLMSGVIGLFIGTIGVDVIAGNERFTFGILGLTTGVDFVPAMIGLFSLPQVMMMASGSLSGSSGIKQLSWRDYFVRWSEIWDLKMTWVRSCIIGAIVGVLPGAGGSVASWLAYNEEKRFSKHPELFGTGIIEGVAAPECANNADTATAYIPLITLGIPGSSAAAVLLGGLLIQGLVPGRELFTTHAHITYAMIIGLIIGNIFVLLLGLLGSNLFAKALRMPVGVLAPMIVALCVMGSYAMENDMFNVYVMLAFGILGYLFKILGFHPAPAMLGLILGEMAEKGFRNGLQLSLGEPLYFIKNPISMVLVAMILLALFSPYLLEKWRQRATPDMEIAKEDD